jgi:hypothetical protein
MRKIEMYSAGYEWFVECIRLTSFNCGPAMTAHGSLNPINKKSPKRGMMGKMSESLEKS